MTHPGQNLKANRQDLSGNIAPSRMVLVRDAKAMDKVDNWLSIQLVVWNGRKIRLRDAYVGGSRQDDGCLRYIRQGMIIEGRRKGRVKESEM